MTFRWNGINISLTRHFGPFVPERLFQTEGLAFQPKQGMQYGAKRYQGEIPRGDRGFLASVLAPDSRATSIKVDEESGVSGLIRPGDYVDVLLTQVFEKGETARRALSETILRNVRVIAIDQEIVQGGRGPSAATGKPSQTVSLELSPEQVNKVTVARQIGKLSLTVRSAIDQVDTGNPGAMSSCDVSPELARQNAVAGQTTAVVVYTGGDVKQYSVRKDGSDASGHCDGSTDVTRQAAAAAAGRLPEKR